MPARRNYLPAIKARSSSRVPADAADAFVEENQCRLKGLGIVEDGGADMKPQFDQRWAPTQVQCQIDLFATLAVGGERDGAARSKNFGTPQCLAGKTIS